MLERKKPGIKTAIRLITEYINSNNLVSGMQLPSASVLAHEFDLSRTTILKALAQLCQKGIIYGTKGHPFIICSTSLGPEKNIANTHKKSTLQLTQTAWHRTKNQLLQDIYSGVFPAGITIPLNKDLKNKYSVCKQTLNKAITCLASEKILIPCKNGFTIPSFTTGIWKPKIICFAKDSKDAGMFLPSEHDEIFLRAFESACHTSGIELDIFLIPYNTDEEAILLCEMRTGTRVTMQDFLKSNQSTLGFLAIAPWNPGKTLDTIARYLKPLKKPFVILDGTGQVTDIEKIDPKHIRMFAPTISEEPAEEVARFLLSMGHREAVFFSPSNEFLWSQCRKTGLQKAFTKANLQDALFDYSCSALESISKSKPPYSISPILKTYATWKKNIPPHLSFNFDKAFINVERAELDTALRKMLYDLFDKALIEHPRAKAWVVVNDFTGCIALDYLHFHKLPVGEKIAILSFDNFTDAIKSNLTSYDFNFPSIAQAALGFILGRKPFTDKQDIKGFIVRRLSTNFVR